MRCGSGPKSASIFLLGADEQLLELEERGGAACGNCADSHLVLAGPPDEFGKLRPLPFADVEIAAVEVLSVPSVWGWSSARYC